MTKKFLNILKCIATLTKHGILEKKKKFDTLLAFTNNLNWTKQFLSASSVEVGQQFLDDWENNSEVTSERKYQGSENRMWKYQKREPVPESSVEVASNSESNSLSVSGFQQTSAHVQLQEPGSDNQQERKPAPGSSLKSHEHSADVSDPGNGTKCTVEGDFNSESNALSVNGFQQTSAHVQEPGSDNQQEKEPAPGSSLESHEHSADVNDPGNGPKCTVEGDLNSESNALSVNGFQQTSAHEQEPVFDEVVTESPDRGTFQETITALSSSLGSDDERNHNPRGEKVEEQVSCSDVIDDSRLDSDFVPDPESSHESDSESSSSEGTVRSSKKKLRGKKTNMLVQKTSAAEETHQKIANSPSSSMVTEDDDDSAFVPIDSASEFEDEDDDDVIIISQETEAALNHVLRSRNEDKKLTLKKENIKLEDDVQAAKSDQDDSGNDPDEVTRTCQRDAEGDSDSDSTENPQLPRKSSSHEEKTSVQSEMK
ncbi:protein starmaker-like [Lineus longissimus]|uniref:protein starmaker-like n=1 Tax=Lineus longissimus TaxID=88925 RepID=UPI00315C7176